MRYTFATELANPEDSVYTLMKLLGHESMVTSQRYVTAAGNKTRTVAAQNKLYDLLAERIAEVNGAMSGSAASMIARPSLEGAAR